MSEIITGHFDGKVIIPDGPVQLPVGEALRLRVEVAKTSPGKFADLLEFAADLPDAPTDLAAQHDHYLYGSPKK